MKTIKAPLGAFLLCLLLCTAARAADTLQLPRADGATVPVMRYPPDNGSACAPVAVLSPGAGGSEKGLAYLAEFLAGQGWLALVMGHTESGPGVLRHDVFHEGSLHNGLADMTLDPAAYRARFMDIDATLAWVHAQCTPPALVLLGHSMGAATVMLAAGARNTLGLGSKDVFDAYVALSPQGTGPGSPFPAHAWSGIGKPVLVLTGTRDKALEGDWQTRLQPYADMPPGCKWQGVIDGATHMNLGGGAFSARVERPLRPAARAPRRHDAGRQMSWFVYLLECEDGSIYTGTATDVERRFHAHRDGKGARYTRAHPPRRLLASLAMPDRGAALREEYRIKQLDARAKRALGAATGLQHRAVAAGQPADGPGPAADEVTPR